MPKHMPTNLVENALDHLWDFGVLGTHPLGAALRLSTRLGRDRAGHMERGRALSQRLLAAIEQLKISHDHPDNSRERRYYAILVGCYVEGHTNRTIAEALSVSERTFYRERREALAVLTRILSDGLESISS